MTPRDLLFVAYHFPPSGGAGVQRSVKFARYLPELGWRPLVVTRPVGAEGRWTPSDATLSAELPESLRVERVAEPEPASPRGARAFLARNLRAPVPFTRWWSDGVLAAGLRAARGAAPALVYTSMDPFESAPAAAALAAALGLPWVADLRDPWALDEVRDYATALHRRLELAHMRKSLASAAAIVMNTPEARSALLEAFPELSAERVHEITNGFDPEDFAVETRRTADGLFRIVHSGSLHADHGFAQARTLRVRRALGGQRVPTELLPRSHYYLLRALERWRDESPEEASSVRLVLIGSLTETDRRIVTESRVSDLVELIGARSHLESVRALLEADLLFLPMHGLPPGERARIVPGKTYEYLASGRPVLAAVPDGDARDWLAESGRALLCRPDDVEGLLRAAQACKREPGRFQRVCAPDASLVPRFGRRALAQRLAQVLDAAASEGPAG